uniref:Uncharacterized protein n=1 Tax=Arundo donax TaxID=35708 RepID=A0A0A9G6U1_ARUDO
MTSVRLSGHNVQPFRYMYQRYDIHVKLSHKIADTVRHISVHIIFIVNNGISGNQSLVALKISCLRNWKSRNHMLMKGLATFNLKPAI